MKRFPESASQTGGPYVHIGLAPQQAGFDIFDNNFGPVLVDAQTLGQRIAIEGQVIDGSGSVLRDVLLEIWQANAAGKYAHPGDRQDLPLDPHFRGWGRGGADFDTGLYRFETIKPGPVVGRGGRLQAPHINLWIVARGINLGLNTRLYFSDEGEANASDPVLTGIEWVVRRQTLIAQRIENNENSKNSDSVAPTVYRFDIRLQASAAGDETVFFDI